MFASVALGGKPVLEDLPVLVHTERAVSPAQSSFQSKASAEVGELIATGPACTAFHPRTVRTPAQRVYLSSRTNDNIGSSGLANLT